MSFSLKDMFTSVTGTTPQNNQPVQGSPGNLPASPNVTATPGNATAPVIPDTTTEKSPLDAFAKLWENDPNKKDAPPKKIFDFDPAKVMEAARKKDFTNLVTPEMQVVINKGGPEAMQLMLQVMSSVGQETFGNSAIATATIIEDALKKQEALFLEKLPGIIKNQNLSDNLRGSNPIFGNPAVAPVLELMKNQVALKFPNATVAEQEKMAQDYVLAFAKAASPADASKNKDQQSGQTDWDSFLNS